MRGGRVPPSTLLRPCDIRRAERIQQYPLEYYLLGIEDARSAALFAAAPLFIFSEATNRVPFGGGVAPSEGEWHLRRVYMGLPQGSIIGPLLWLISYDPVFRVRLPPGCRLFGFADDIGMVVSATTLAGLHAAVRAATDGLAEVAGVNVCTL